MASNQPNQPPRPWLRLTSLAARTNIPTPAPAPALRPQQPQAEAPPPPAPTTVVAARPTFRPPAPESHPSTEPQPPPTSPPKPVPGATSPPKRAAALSPAIKTTSSSPPAATKKPSTSPTAAANLSRSLKPAAESPPHSRNTPPSPLTLPPPQLKSLDAEQKTVLFQNTKPTSNSHLDHAAGKKEKGHKKPSEETGVRSVITIAGENRGAFMELFKSPRQKRLEGHHHLQKKSINGKSLNDDSAGSGEHLQSYSSEEAKRRSVKQAAAPMNAAAAYMNSNVQGVNNSIVYNSSYTHHDPGVHLAFSKKPSGSGGKGN